MSAGVRWTPAAAAEAVGPESSNAAGDRQTAPLPHLREAE